MERRTQYRAMPDEPVLDVTIIVPAIDGPIPAEIEDLTIAGALVRVPRGLQLQLPIGDPLSLCIGVEGRRRVNLMSTLVHCRARKRSQLLGIRFDDPVTSESLLDPALVSLMNRRQNYRVPPDPATPVPVTLQCDDPEVPLEQAALIDVATGGLGVEVSLGFERLMAGRDQVECLLFLPGTAQPIAVPGRVVHRALEGQRVRYGIAFEGLDTPSRSATRDVLLGYVLRRQRELTREGQGDETLQRMLARLEPA